MISLNPLCHLPTTLSRHAPQLIACSRSPSFLENVYSAVTSPLGSTYTTLRTAMDVFLNLPFFSVLLIPTMTSYSTSLNLLFFYLTWSTLVLSHPPLRVELVASLAIQIVFYVLPSGVFLLFDLVFPSISASLKALGSEALPFRNFTRRTAPHHLKVVTWSLANVLTAVAAQALIEYTLVTVFHTSSALKVTTTLPLPWRILKDITRGFLLRDLLTYCIHRYILHNASANALTRDLTHLHESWYHATVPAPYPLSASHDHPLTYLLHIFLPTYLPAYIWRFHLLTYMLFLLLVTLEQTITQSGYASLPPTRFIVGGIARRKDLHCLSGGTGNFGTIGLMDWIMDTSLGGDIADEILMEVEERNVKDKVRRRASRTAKKALNGVRNGSIPSAVSTARRSSPNDVVSDGRRTSGSDRTRASARKTRAGATRRRRLKATVESDPDDEYTE